MKNLFLFLIASALCFNSQAQEIPDDINIKTGVLSNGMTYYIKGNRFPSDKLELKLVVKVGSIVEEDNEQGLAHFLEHMCFNGTENFEKNELISYLQSIGVKFGAHLNAYTTFDRTVYRLTIPADKKKEVEQGFQILEDWAFNLSLTNEEIEKERGIILEEYRRRLGAENRMKEKYYPNLLYHSRYSDRMPIGKKEVLENFDPEVLRSFYKKWYRPDLMAVIAVGDISTEELEDKIRKHFDKPISTENPKERIYYADESHKETLVSIVSDEEAIANSVSIYYKNPAIQQEENTEISQEGKLRERLFSIMINNRFLELTNSNNPPFIYGSARNIKSRIKNKKNYLLYAKVISNDYLLATKTLLTESERVKKYGFTNKEFDRALESLRVSLKRDYLNSRYQSSNKFVSQMETHFLEGKAMPASAWVDNFNQAALPKIILEDINALSAKYFKKDNRVVVIKGAEKLVSEKQIKDLIFEVENDQNIKAYEDLVVEKELFTEQLEPGEITEEEKNDLYNITSITLSNGVKVHYKKRRYGNTILFNCKSQGGTSLHSTEDYFESHYALTGITSAGIGGFNKNELALVLTGNTAKVYPSIYNQLEMMEGSSSPADLETLFQLIYLNFTQLNKDKDAFNAYKERAKSSIDNILLKPEVYFANEFNKFQYAKDERRIDYPTPEDYDNTNYDLAYDIYQKRFENAADFNFVFVGNFDEETFLSLAKKYLANLPASSERESSKDRKMNALSGDYTKIIRKGIEEKSKVQIVYRGDYPYNTDEAIAFNALKDILQIKLTEKLREEMSGVYSRSVVSRFDRMYKSYSLKIRFECAPENVDKLIAATKAEINKIITNGPTKEDLNKAKEAILLSRKSTSSSSRFWLKTISDAAYFGTDINEEKKYEKRVSALSLKDIQSIAQKFLDKGAVVGILLPEEK